MRGNAKKPGKGRGRRATTLFGGILRCGECGGAIVATEAYRYGCAAHKDRGPSVCSHSAKLGRKELDTRLSRAIRERLISPDTLGLHERYLRDELAASESDERAERAGLA